MRQDRSKARGQPITLDIVKLAEPNGPQSVLEVVDNALTQLRDGQIKWLFAELSVGHCLERVAVVGQCFGDAAEG